MLAAASMNIHVDVLQQGPCWGLCLCVCVCVWSVWMVCVCVCVGCVDGVCVCVGCGW